MGAGRGGRPWRLRPEYRRKGATDDRGADPPADPWRLDVADIDAKAPRRTAAAGVTPLTPPQLTFVCAAFTLGERCENGRRGDSRHDRAPDPRRPPDRRGRRPVGVRRLPAVDPARAARQGDQRLAARGLGLLPRAVRPGRRARRRRRPARRPVRERPAAVDRVARPGGRRRGHGARRGLADRDPRADRRDRRRQRDRAAGRVRARPRRLWARPRQRGQRAGRDRPLCGCDRRPARGRPARRGRAARGRPAGRRRHVRGGRARRPAHARPPPPARRREGRRATAAGRATAWRT